MKKFVVALSREYGSGGREIAQKLAEKLNVGCYDKSIIKMTAEKSGLAAGFVEKSEEKVENNFLFNLKYSSYAGLDSIVYYETPTNDKMFIAQSAVIKEIAEQESCVIIGRCGDYVLREQENLIRIFIRADLEYRAANAVENYGLPEKGAASAIRKIDKARANYYKYYTNGAWGAADHSDIIINSEVSGIDGAVEIILALLRAKGFAD